jgi:protocatechuate 3,4-dioxygenase beta subunit
MRHSILVGLIALQMTGTGCAQDTKKVVGGGCDGCELMFEGMPKTLGWRTTVPGPGEPGEPLEMSGVIYRKDGRTPAPGVILYVYHTDAKGYYSPAPGQTLGRRHGHLRGWMRTGPDGRYQFRTLRPAPYPGQRIPAHIHPVVKEPGKNEYYLDEYVFDGDPRLTPEKRAELEDRGGSGIVKLTRSPQGVWVGRRDIVLGRNIPDYPPE